MPSQNRDPIRVVRIIARLNVGGPARHVAWLTAGMNDDRFTSLLVTGTIAPGERDLGGFARAMGVEPIVIGEMSRTISWKDAVVVWKLLRLFFRERPDIIHTHTAKAGAVGRTAGFLYRVLSRRRVRFVHTFHGHVFHGYYSRAVTAFFLFIERVLARMTDIIIVLSPRLRDEIHERYRVGRPQQFRIIPLGLEVDMPDAGDAADAFLRDARVEPNGFVSGIVGRLTEVKDHAFLLSAVAEWVRTDATRGGKATFLIIGEGHLREALQQSAQRLGLEKHVRFVGNRDDPEVFYRALDLLVLTSRNEGTPLSILEAMATGVPVLSTAVGGVPDLLGATLSRDDGVLLCERGLLIEHGDVAAFGRAMSMLIDNASLRAEITTRAGEYVRRNYSRDRLLRDMRALYQELCGT